MLWKPRISKTFFLVASLNPPERGKKRRWRERGKINRFFQHGFGQPLPAGVSGAEKLKAQKLIMMFYRVAFKRGSFSLHKFSLFSQRQEYEGKTETRQLPSLLFFSLETSPLTSVHPPRDQIFSQPPVNHHLPPQASSPFTKVCRHTARDGIPTGSNSHRAE